MVEKIFRWGNLRSELSKSECLRHTLMPKLHTNDTNTRKDYIILYDQIAIDRESVFRCDWGFGIFGFADYKEEFTDEPGSIPVGRASDETSLGAVRIYVQPLSENQYWIKTYTPLDI